MEKRIREVRNKGISANRMATRTRKAGSPPVFYHSASFQQWHAVTELIPRQHPPVNVCPHPPKVGLLVEEDKDRATRSSTGSGSK